jgi:acyl-ACP thioesterase
MAKLEHFQEFRIGSYNVDFQGKATVQSMMQFLEDIGWEHAGLLNLGFSDILKQDLIWVLVRFKIKIKKFPGLHDTVKVKTWAGDKDKLFWYRDYKIFDSDKNELARATSTFIIINIKTRRPHRSDNMFKLKFDVEERSFPEKLEKLPAVDDEEVRYKKVVSTSDLDLNDHVNNIKYIEWILDSYPLQFFKEKQVETLEVNYLAEAHYGDTVLVNSQMADLIHLHRIKRDSDNKELFRARIKWKKRI